MTRWVVPVQVPITGPAGPRSHAETHSPQLRAVRLNEKIQSIGIGQLVGLVPGLRVSDLDVIQCHDGASSKGLAGWCAHEWYLLDVKREWLEYPDLKRAVIAQQRAWRADKVLIEYANAGLSLWQEMKVDGPFLPSLIKPKGDKAERLTGKTAQLEEGRFLLPREAPWLAAFQSELRASPFGRHDDQVDAMTQFLEFELGRWRWVETDYDERGRPQQIIRRSRRRG